MSDENNFLSNLNMIRNRIRKACVAAGRIPESVKILPVTKTMPPEVYEWTVKAGFKSVGENRLQEVVQKARTCPEGLKIELIGHLQSNKAKVAVTHCTRIQSVDSEKLLRRLNKLCLETDRQIHVLLQINAGNDPSKFGVSPADAPKILDTALDCENLHVDGLMTIAPLDPNSDVARNAFARLRTLRDTLEKKFEHALPELSMGMSGDLEAAIAEGSTLIRIGTALFGQRANG